MRLTILLLVIFFQNISFGQNLLPNSSFESTTNLEYTYPFSAFAYLDIWYRANYFPTDTLLYGTPDLFDNNNRWPSVNPPGFWEASGGAVEGDFYVGITNDFKFEGYTTPEAIAAPLLETLEANTNYHIELMVRNKGVMGIMEEEPKLCVPEEYKGLKILLNEDSIYVTIDLMNRESYHNASKVVTLNSTRLASSILGGWNKIGTCFQADGSEQFLAISHSVGTFEVNPPCFIYDDNWSSFYTYYYDIDDVKLTKLPESFTINQTICNGHETKFNVAELIDLPIMQKEIEYHWEDGVIDSINYISEAGTYRVDAILDCTTIPVTLEIADLNCVPNIFVPNVFSPNGDGVNDYLKPFIAVDLPIQKYRFSVYNRWGTKVFSTQNNDIRWDGTFNGSPVDAGVYIWILEGTIDNIQLGLKTYQESGDVTIVR